MAVMDGSPAASDLLPPPDRAASPPRAQLAREAARPVYRARLGAVTAAAAIPQGYTLTTWASGALVAHAAGLPDLWRALAFLVCSALAFGGVASAAASRAPRHASGAPPSPLRAGAAPTSPWPQLLAAITAVALVDAVVALVPGALAWPLAGLGATATYFLAVPGWGALLARP